jgi:hypothetical protein
MTSGTCIGVGSTARTTGIGGRPPRGRARVDSRSDCGRDIAPRRGRCCGVVRVEVGSDDALSPTAVVVVVVDADVDVDVTGADVALLSIDSALVPSDCAVRRLLLFVRAIC